MTLEIQLKNQLTKFVGPLSHNEYKELRSEIEICDLSAGDLLFKKGDSEEGMYFLLYGKLRAIDDSLAGKPRVLGDIFHGETVGEMGLLSDARRSATVVALRESVIARFKRETFLNLIKTHSNALLSTAKTIVERLDRSNQKQSEPPRDKVVLLWASPTDEQAQQARANLIQILCTRFNGVHKTSNDCNPNELQEELHRNEYHFDYYLLSNDSNDEWNAAIAGLVDTIVLFDSDQASARALSTEYIEAKNWNLVDRFLVQCIAPNSASYNSAGALKHFNPSQVLKCRMDEVKDLQRIARIITDNGIALALSGGGAHGFAHLGVLKALRENDIPIDYIGGSSIGAIMGAGIALDWPLEKILKNVKRDISIQNPLTDYTYPVIAILRGKRMKARLKKYFDLPIENCWVNYCCVASNYLNGKKIVLETGSMYEAITSSISIPGVLPPNIYNETYLLDGGVLENVPVYSIRERFKGKLITVDLSSIKEFKVKDAGLPSGWSLLLRRFIPFIKKKKVPRLMNVIMKSMTLSSINQGDEVKSLSDVYLNPQIKTGFLEWTAFDQIVEAGYLYTKELLKNPDIKRSLLHHESPQAPSSDSSFDQY
jgi:NTE family protein